STRIETSRRFFDVIRNRTESNIASIMAVLEVNSGYCLVRARTRGFDGRSQCGNCQYTTAGRHNFTIRTLGPSMKNLHVAQLRCRAEPGDGFAGVVLVR